MRKGQSNRMDKVTKDELSQRKKSIWENNFQKSERDTITTEDKLKKDRERISRFRPIDDTFLKNLH